MRRKDISLLVICFGLAMASCTKDLPKASDPAAPVVIIDPDDPNHPLAGLPKDTGGIHEPYPLGSNASPFGYYLYTPSAFGTAGVKFPLLIFLHGAGEVGNSQTDSKALDKLLDIGPPLLITNKTWAPKYPMIVVSIQSHDGWWDYLKVKQFTEFMIANYDLDTTRIYMTGVSIGANATWDQASIFGKASHITAAVPVSGTGPLEDIDVVTYRVKKSAEIAIWAFHGSEDRLVSPDFDITMRGKINALNPVVPMRLTLFSKMGHEAWMATYSRTGVQPVEASYDPFGMSIYTWMANYKKVLQ